MDTRGRSRGTALSGADRSAAAPEASTAVAVPGGFAELTGPRGGVV